MILNIQHVEYLKHSVPADPIKDVILSLPANEIVALLCLCFS